MILHPSTEWTIPAPRGIIRPEVQTMTLLSSTYGKSRVRVMRLWGEGDRREVRELTVRAMLTGDIARAYTAGDNSTSSTSWRARTCGPGRNTSAAPWRAACSTAIPA